MTLGNIKIFPTRIIPRGLQKTLGTSAIYYGVSKYTKENIFVLYLSDKNVIFRKKSSIKSNCVIKSSNVRSHSKRIIKFLLKELFGFARKAEHLAKCE